MRRPIQNVLGALLLITALICTQIPALPTAASTQASGDMIMEGSTLVQYVGTAKTLVIPSSVKSIGENAFAACTTLESVSIPTDVTSIGGAAFSNCTSLKSVYIKGSGLRSLGDGAFAGCTSLKSVHIPAGLTSMGYKPFDGCTALTTITIDPANPAFVLQDGKLFTKDLKKQVI